jgi:divalent metal cation (Fe/Co/Zn/Cd) transporter
MTINQAHEISHLVEEAISSKIKNVNVMVHAEPESH